MTVHILGETSDHRNVGESIPRLLPDPHCVYGTTSPILACMDPSQNESQVVGASNDVLRDGFVQIESVDTTKGRRILLPMRLDFPEGQIYAILGPSGSGKTTFLNTIADNIQSNIRACGEGKSCCQQQT